MEYYYILIFHGSNNSKALDIINKFKDSLSKHLKKPFCICFLKGNDLTFSQALEEAFKNNYKQIKCLPLFVLPGSHVSDDIPIMIKNFKVNHNNCKIDLLPSLSESKFFIDFIIKSLEL